MCGNYLRIEYISFVNWINYDRRQGKKETDRDGKGSRLSFKAGSG